MSKNKRGLSLEDKRKAILSIYHTRKEAFNLKEIENFGSKLGVVQQTIKDVNQSLIDDFLVLSDKIGSANFFWSFPSKSYQDQVVQRDNNLLLIQQSQQNTALLKSQIENERLCRVGSDRTDKLRRLLELNEQEKSLDARLEELKANDPEEIRRVEVLAGQNKVCADRWTDNVWQIKSYLTKRKGLPGKEVRSMYC